MSGFLAVLKGGPDADRMIRIPEPMNTLLTPVEPDTRFVEDELIDMFTHNEYRLKEVTSENVAVYQFVP
jgi:hypothetical protein